MKNESSDAAAKFIISVPKEILSPKSIEAQVQHYTDDDFLDCMVDASFYVGSTSFSMADVKRLEAGDVVVLEHSDSSSMTLTNEGINQKFQIRPNSRIVEPYEATVENSMEDNMGNSNLWDSIQVDLSAEFEKVKVPLGELKSIEEGLVVDLCSVYDNKVYLKVGEKTVATGGLVIINDRFGVRIENVPTNESDLVEEENTEMNNQENSPAGDNFDYSDFEADENQG